MFIDTNKPIKSDNHVRQFAEQTGTWDGFRSQWQALPEDSKKDILSRSLTGYLEELLHHDLAKGVRPWELVDVTSDNDPEQAWIGVEWETGFCSENHYKATVAWLWENQNNWALDAEGMGPWAGEFTFPPCNLSDWIEGTSPLDKMRGFMAENSIPTPATPADWGDTGYWRNQDVRDGWGMHINISVPLMRTNRRMADKISLWISRCMNSYTFTDTQLIRLFGRDPYGWSYHRTDGTTCWIEFKLFRTPGSDEEVERIRKIAANLANLIRWVTENIDSCAEIIGETSNAHRNYYEMQFHYPSRDNLYNYLMGKEEFRLTESSDPRNFYLSPEN